VKLREALDLFPPEGTASTLRTVDYALTLAAAQLMADALRQALEDAFESLKTINALGTAAAAQGEQYFYVPTAIVLTAKAKLQKLYADRITDMAALVSPKS
jgi:hypothetical protein